MFYALWALNYKRYYYLPQHNQHFLPWRFGLYQRPSSEEACSILPVLATIVMQRGKKLVVCVAQRVAALVAVQGLSTILEPGRGLCCCSAWLICHHWRHLSSLPVCEDLASNVYPKWWGQRSRLAVRRQTCRCSLELGSIPAVVMCVFRQIFLSKSYDATSHFETTCADVLDIFRRATGADFDFSNVKHNLEDIEWEKADGR